MKEAYSALHVARDDQRTLTCSAPHVSHISSLALPPSTFREISPKHLRMFANGDTGTMSYTHSIHS